MFLFLEGSGGGWDGREVFSELACLKLDIRGVHTIVKTTKQGAAPWERVPVSLSSVTEDTSLAVWSDVLGILQGLRQKPVAVIVSPRGRQVQCFSSLGCVINTNRGPAL